ncbi:hypothetical protein JB92DRAFT_735256 [Gautieria morchelliformis]|nr:hypothetical protein JB92DRAFT_735256 [Gautieria morchelliformis]
MGGIIWMPRGRQATRWMHIAARAQAHPPPPPTPARTGGSTRCMSPRTAMRCGGLRSLRADGWAVRGSADMNFMREDEYVYDGPSPKLRAEHEGRFIRDTQGKEGGSFSKWVDELDAAGEARWRNRRQGERVVGLAVDMVIAARAEVFIGNGWSSYTANINLLRMAHGALRASIRFW